MKTTILLSLMSAVNVTFFAFMFSRFLENESLVYLMIATGNIFAAILSLVVSCKIAVND